MKSIIIHLEESEYNALLKIKNDRTWKQILLKELNKKEGGLNDAN